MRLPRAGRVTLRWRLVLAVFAGLVGIWATCELGFWQLRRAAGKEAIQQQVEAAAAATPRTPDAASLAAPASLAHQHLVFRGTWVPEHVVYLDNRPSAGRAGLLVLMALRIERPVPTEIIVDRGWIARDPADRSRIAPYRTPDGVVEVSGLALDDEPRLLELARPAEQSLGGIWQNFDFDAYARVARSVPPRMIVRQDPMGASDDGLSRDWPDRGGTLQAQIDRHHGYAFQWFALATTLALLLLYRGYRILRHDRPIPR